jgi:hypothetical protein
VNAIFRSWFRSRKATTQRRLDNANDTATHPPVFSAQTIHYDVSHRQHAINCGGIGAILRRKSEEVAEFEYRPSACTNTYRMVGIRKPISREKGEPVLFPAVRYFFYLTNDRQASAAQIVFEANDRCNPENLLAQFHGGASPGEHVGE